MKRIRLVSKRVMQLSGVLAFVAGAAVVACSGTSASGFGGDGGLSSTGPTTVATGCAALASCCTTLSAAQQPACTAAVASSTSATCDADLAEYQAHAFCLTTVSGTGTGTATVLMSPDAGNGSSTGSSGSGKCTYLPTDTTDHDGDGWSSAQGDCNDCNKFINPGAYDIPANGIDEDCDGKVDDEPTGCDSTLTSVATTVGTDGATAMDLCRAVKPAGPKTTWGVVSADYVLPDGTSSQAGQANFELGFGVLGPAFGTSNKTQQGVRMLGLSSGTARGLNDPGFSDPANDGVAGFDKGFTSGAPNGFPGTTPACPGVTFGAAHDGAALRVVIRVPTNALTMSFDSNFFSSEFPDYVCSPYNDTYVVIMTPSPAGEPATANDNIAFDSKGNVISVNAGFLTVCDPNSMTSGPTYACAEGAGKLAGTCFAEANAPDMEDHAATDWLTTTVSVATLAGQEITLLFAIWDSSDGFLDSTVLIDNVAWTFATAPNQVPPTVTTPPMTLPK